MCRLDNAALLVIDVQQGFDDPYWGEPGSRSNPACEQNIAALIRAWRELARPIVFVRHDSVVPDSPLRPGQRGNEFMPCVTGIPDLLIRKTVNSSFYGEPALDPWLRARGIETLVLCGIQTNFCVETTARMAGNLGYDVRVALDATATFDGTGPDGERIPADLLMRVSAANLDPEFARVTSTRELLEAVPGPLPRHAPARRLAAVPGRISS